MMKRIALFSLSVALTMMATSACWTSAQLPEGTPRLLLDRTEVSLPSENAEGGVVTDTLTVTSNRSWSAHVEDGASWLTLRNDERVNLENFTAQDILVLVADDNLVKEDRNAVITITTETLTQTIDIIQGSLVPRLAIPAKDSFKNLSSEASSYTLVVETNVEWTATLSEGAESFVKISQTSGTGYTELTILVSENFDVESGNEATITFSAEGCEDVVVPVTQLSAIPFVHFTDKDDMKEAEPGRFNSIVSFKTNASWTAEIVDNDGFSSPSLSATSGGTGDSAITVSFPPASCFGKVASMKIRVTPSGGTSCDLLLTQIPVIRLRFYDLENKAAVSAEEWPLTYPLKSELPTTKTGTSDDPYFMTEHYMTHISGYKVKVFSRAGLWYASNVLNGGGSGASAPATYFVTPAISGVKLTKVYYQAIRSSVSKHDWSVREADKETVVSGGEQFSLTGENPSHTWTLTGTKENTEYILWNPNTGNLYLGDLIFYYE